MFLHKFSLTSPPERRFRDIQIVIITNFVVVSNLAIKRVLYILLMVSRECYTVESQWREQGWLVYHGNFKSFLSPFSISSESSRKQILRGIFLFYQEIVCCVYSLESHHQGDSNEYTIQTIIM